MSMFAAIFSIGQALTDTGQIGAAWGPLMTLEPYLMGGQFTKPATLISDLQGLARTGKTPEVADALSALLKILVPLLGDPKHAPAVISALVAAGLPAPKQG